MCVLCVCAQRIENDKYDPDSLGPIPALFLRCETLGKLFNLFVSQFPPL